LKSFFHKITNGLASVSQVLLSYGPFGLFAVALLDSALIPMPGGPDAIMMLLSAARPGWVLVYVAAATMGSVAGCIILYNISRRAGRGALSRFSEAKQARVKDLMDRYDMLSVLVASILPPPFPFKLFVISAGVFGFRLWRFAVAVAVGRAFRFLLVGYLAARFGSRAKDLLAHYYPAIGIGLAVVIVAIFLARSVFKNRDSLTA